jgi:soluble lytic murein transglycosylase-like protein
VTKLTIVVFFAVACAAHALTPNKDERLQAEYYVQVYARHYGVPITLVRSIVQQESGWKACVVSPKGAVGLMQLMPTTAARLGVRNRCDIAQNVSGGVRYLSWLIRKFHGDLRLVTAAFYAGEGVVEKRGLKYGNRDVVMYVSQIRSACRRQEVLSKE